MNKFHKLFSLSATSAIVAAATPVMAASVAVPTSQDVEVIVTYKNISGKESTLAAAKEVVTDFSVISALTVVIDESQITSLKANPNIQSVERNVKVETADTAETFEVMDSAVLSGTTEQSTNWGFQAVNKEGASFAKGITGKGVKVAIIDSGIQSHPDLRIAGGVSTVDGVTSYSDDNGHGTHVAGIIAAQNNNMGTVGVAPDVQLYAVKALPAEGSGNLNDVMEGIQWAIQQHMDIINMSLGSESNVFAMQKMLQAADDQGILVVAAAGNDYGLKPVNYPAQYATTIAVSAVDSNRQFASFSNYGPSIDISAPGVDIVSTYLNGQLAIGSGTSQATPHVTGILALLKQQFPNMTDDQLKEELYKRAEDLGPVGYDVKYGNGLANIGDITPPKEVTNLKATVIDYQKVKLNWQNPSDMDFASVNIYVNGNKVMNIKGDEFVVDGLKPNTTYVFAIKTIDSWNNESVGITNTTTTAPVPVSNEAPSGGMTPSAPPVGNPVPAPNQSGPNQPIPQASKPAPSQTAADLVKEVKTEAAKAQKQYAANIKNAASAQKARKDLAKSTSSLKTSDTRQLAKIIGQYQAVISYYAKTKSYGNVLATVKEATVNLSKKKVDPTILIETVLKPNITSSNSANAVISEMKKNNLTTKTMEAFRNELKQAEVGRAILNKHQQNASAYSKRKAYANVVKEISAGVIEATKANAPESDILAFVKKNVKSASSVQSIINEMKKAKLNTSDLEKYKNELK